MGCGAWRSTTAWFRCCFRSRRARRASARSARGWEIGVDRMDELFYASAAALARRIRERELSSEEVVRAHLQRIAAINGRLNAVVQLDEARALEAARAADAA